MNTADTQSILIVDDTPANLAVVVEALEHHQYRVFVAQDGEEGVQRAKLVRPHLILLDIMMPGTDGIEVCRRLKAQAETQDIPVLFMTALTGSADKVAGFAAGGVDYITKPFQLDEVLARIATHLKLRAMQRQLEAQNVELRNYRERLEERVAVRTAELREANERLRLKSFALNQVREAAYLIDEDARFLYVNDESCRALGYSAAELLKMTVMDIGPEWTAEVWAAHWRDLGTHGSLTIEALHRRKDGSTFPVEISASRFAYGGKEYNLALVRDITERKRAEHRRHASEQTFRALVENAPDPIIRYDRECRRVYVNPAACAIYGCTDADLLGKIPQDLSRLPEGARFVDAVRRVLATGEAGTIDFLYRNAHGEVRWGHSRLAPEYDADGNVVSVLSVARDVHDIKESERRFRTLAENSPDNIARYDTCCRAVYVNPRLEATTHMTAAELLGRTPAQAHPDADLSPYMASIESVIATGAASEHEAVLADTGDGPRYHHIRIVAERNESGQIVGALALGRDISERKQTENTLSFIAQRGWNESIETFLCGLARHLGETLGVDYVVIDRLAEPGIAETVALYAKGSIVPNMRYALKDTPCDNVMGKTLCCHPQGVQAQFPADALLAQMGVDSYAGIPLWDSAGQAIGLIAVMDGKPLRNAQAVARLLQIVAMRAAAELERERADTVLRASERKFRTLTEHSPDNIARYDRNARIIYVNPSLERTLNTAAAAMIGSTVRERNPDGSYEDYAALVDAILAGGAAGEIEKTLPGLPGQSPQVHLIRMVPERNEDGEIVGVLTLGRDITERKKAERKLVLLDHALNRSNDAVYLVDYQLRLIYVNDAACRAVGYSREELLEMQLTDIDPDVTREMVQGLMTETLAAGSYPGVLETRHRTRGGLAFPVEISAAVFEYGGEPLFLTVARDISERKRAEQERQEHLRFLESMDRINRTIQGAADVEEMMGAVLDEVLAIFACDRAFLMYPCDPEAATWSVPVERNRPEYPGVSERGAVMPMDADVARTLRLLLDADGPVKFGPGTEHPLPADAAEQFGFRCFMSLALRPKIGKPWQFGIHQCSHARIWTAGEERLLLEVGRRLADGLTGLLAFRDLQASEWKFRSLVENTPDLIVRYNLDLCRSYVNPAWEELSGLSAAEVVEVPIAAIRKVPQAAVEAYVAKIRAALETGMRQEIEFDWTNAHGTVLSLSYVLVPEFDPQGEVAGVLAVGRDISQLREAERRLAESYAMLQELSSRRETAREEERKRIAREIHDELGQHLTALRMGVSTLRFQFGRDNPVLAARIQDMMALADKTIQVVRHVAAALRPAVLDTGLGPALEWLAAEFERHAGIPCAVELDKADYRRLSEDRAMALFRIVQESLTNVARHAKAEWVCISLVQRGDDCIVEIRDGGQGFDPATVGGKTFGLVGMRERALMFGGTIDLDSKPGGGTKVIVRIGINDPRGAP